MPLNSEPEASMPPSGKDGFLLMMEKYEIPLTRENYLDLVYLGNAPEELSAEEEAELPEMFQAK